MGCDHNKAGNRKEGDKGDKESIVSMPNIIVMNFCKGKGVCLIKKTISFINQSGKFLINRGVTGIHSRCMVGEKEKGKEKCCRSDFDDFIGINYLGFRE